MKKWQVREVDSEVVKTLAKDAGVSEFVSYMLVARGIVDRAAADAFFNSEEISSPLEIADMEKAVEVIHAAIEDGKKITVYGDYDCDGVTSTVILVTYLQMVGADVDWYIPSRDEGYGLNLNAIDRCAENGTELIITVDNGISAIEEAKYIAEKGIELVITDHHQVPDELPEAAAVVSPHRSDDYSECKELAGCGVALKLVMALEEDVDGMAEQFSDLAAIGTIADIVPLTSENRVIVKRGLDTMLCTENAGLYSLLRQCKIDSEERLSSTALGFSVCPRINAAGRFAHASEAVDLLLCENQTLAATKAEKLTLLNTQRQQAEIEIVKAIEAQISADENILNKRVIIVSGNGWSHGVIGIVASRLLSKYAKPVIVITIEGETARASARSVAGFSLYKLLDSLKEMLLRFGGHTKAAGFSLETAKIDEFTEKVLDYAAENYPTMPNDVVFADKEVTAQELTIENIEALEYFQPFGEGNPSPVFMLRNCTIKTIKSLKDGKYVSFTVQPQGSRTELKILHFGSTFENFRYKAGTAVDMLLSADINEYNGEKSVSLRVKDIRLSVFGEGKNQDKFFAAKSAYEKLRTDEFVEPSLISRIIPEKKDLRNAYDIIRNCNSLSFAGETAFSQGINYCMFRVCLDVFKEKGLINEDIVGDRVTLIPQKEKADLSTSEHLLKLQKQIENYRAQ